MNESIDVTQQMLARVKDAFREAEVDDCGRVLMSGKGARTMIECGALDPDSCFNASPEAETLVDLAERHPGLRLVLSSHCSHFRRAADWEANDVVTLRGEIYISTIQGTISPEGFCDDAFWMIRCADEASIVWIPDGRISLYAWWD